MTALAAARQTEAKTDGRRFAYKVKGSTKIYAGSMVMLTGGYAAPAVAAAGNKGVVGCAEATADNSSGADGAITVVVSVGRFRFTGVGLAQTDVGKAAYASDDQTFSTTQGTNEPLAGWVAEYVSATDGWIEIEPELQL